MHLTITAFRVVGIFGLVLWAGIVFVQTRSGALKGGRLAIFILALALWAAGLGISLFAG
jgi:hypothetical protein